MMITGTLPAFGRTNKTVSINIQTKYRQYFPSRHSRTRGLYFNIFIFILWFFFRCLKGSREILGVVGTDVTLKDIDEMASAKLKSVCLF